MATLRMLILLLAFGCGAQGVGQVQVESWPQSGLSGFRLYTADEAPLLDTPFWLLPPGVDVDEPSPVVRDDGVLFVWVTARPRGAGGSFIGLAAAPELLRGGGDLVRSLDADQPWEGGALRHPTVLADPRAPDAYLMVYQGASGAVGLARATGPIDEGSGLDFRKAGWLDLGVQPLAASAVIVGTRLRVYYLVAGGDIYLAEAELSDLPQGPLSRTGPILSAPLFSVPVNLGQPTPAEGLTGLAARRMRTPAGRDRFDLFVVATAAERAAAAAASSYDGESFLAARDPILARGGGAPSAPIAITYRGWQVLLLGLKAAQTGIAVAHIP